MAKVKICGLSDAGAVAAAVSAGADYVGFVFYARSPRHVSLDQAVQLAQNVPAGVGKVGLFVDAGDEEISAAARSGAIDYLQLHGQENPDRVAEIRARFGLPVIKSIPIAAAEDAGRAAAFELVADMLLFDAKPPVSKDALPGGNGLVFDWNLIAGRKWARPWILSGGLNVENVADAIRVSGAKMVDVSSGVERTPGIKDLAKISAFIETAKPL
jgi:phosphoribosylanthranilate isomerase